MDASFVQKIFAGRKASYRLPLRQGDKL